MRHIPFDCIALYRLGDFYEAFGDDATRLAQLLKLTLTRRANGDIVACFPTTSRRANLAKLLSKGIRMVLVSEICCPY